MKTYIFTDNEREAIKDYLNGEPVDPNFWGVIIHRIKRYNLGILADVDLMMKVLSSISKGDESKEIK